MGTRLSDLIDPATEARLRAAAGGGPAADPIVDEGPGGFEAKRAGGYVDEVKDESAPLEHKSASLKDGGAQVLDVDDETGLVTALVAVTGVEDKVKDTIEPGAFTETLANHEPIGVWSHDDKVWVSRTEDAVELMPGDPFFADIKTMDGKPWPKEAGAVKVDTRFNLETPHGAAAFSDVKFFQGKTGWSIGYRATKAQRNVRTGARSIKALNLFEYSPVMVGAASQPLTLAVKSAAGAVDHESDLGIADLELIESLSGEELKAWAGVRASVGLDAETKGMPPWLRAKKPSMDGGRFPIGNEEDLRNAIQAFGRAKDADKPKVKAWIMKRARELGKSSLIPDSWGGEKSYTPEPVWPDGEALEGAETKTGEDLEVKDRVRTPAGQRRYGQPIGSVIVADIIPSGPIDDAGLAKLRAAAKDEPERQLIDRAKPLDPSKRRAFLESGGKPANGTPPLLGDGGGRRRQATAAERADAWPNLPESQKYRLQTRYEQMTDVGIAVEYDNLVGSRGGSEPLIEVEKFRKAELEVQLAKRGMDPAAARDGRVAKRKRAGEPVGTDPRGGTAGRPGSAAPAPKPNGKPNMAPVSLVGNKGRGETQQRIVRIRESLKTPAAVAALKEASGKVFDGAFNSAGHYVDQALTALLRSDDDGDKAAIPELQKIAQALATGRKSMLGALNRRVEALGFDGLEQMPLQLKSVDLAELTDDELLAHLEADPGSEFKGSQASLDRSPRANWVENTGQLPGYIREVARAIERDHGVPLSRAIPMAIGRIKRWAAGGDNVTAATRAKAAAAVAKWEALKAAAHAKSDAELWSSMETKTLALMGDVEVAWETLALAGELDLKALVEAADLVDAEGEPAAEDDDLDDIDLDDVEVEPVDPEAPADAEELKSLFARADTLRSWAAGEV